MLNPDKVVELDDISDISVEEMIDILHQYPPHYTVKVDGDRYGYIHVDDEDEQIIINSSSRSDEYNY